MSSRRGLVKFTLLNRGGLTEVKKMIKIAVSGSRGRMGSMILKLAETVPQLKVVGRFDKDDDPQGQVKNCDCLIEFTTPEATVKNLEVASTYGKAMVIGTTGLNEEQKKAVEEASRKIPIVISPNMAIGVNLLFKLAAEAARALDRAYEPSISETHHVHKKDAPSGTAKKLAQLIAGARDIPPDKIKIEAKREGEVTGDHTVIFNGAEEKLELFHRAKTRLAFAKGALEAAKFVVGKKPKLYNMFDVLGLK